MSLNEEERVLLEQDALKMAETFNEFFQQPNTIAVTGGVEGVDVTEENRINAISIQDSCAIDGGCNTNRDQRLNAIDVPHNKIIYDTPGNEIAELAIGKNVFLSGGPVANPLSRLIGTDIAPEELNEITIYDMVKNRRYPVTFSVEAIKSIQPSNPTNQKPVFDPKSIGVEASRTAEGIPNWVLDLELNSDARFYIPSNKEEGYEQINKTQRTKYLSRQFVPTANGAGWSLDYGIIGMHENPLDESKNIFSIQGAHGTSNLGGNAIIMNTEDISGKVKFSGNTETLSTIYGILKDKNITNYQAIFATTIMPYGRIDNINNTLIGVIALD